MKNIENTHKRTLQQIEDSKLISEAKVTGIAKARVAQDAENKKADEDQRFAKQRAQALAEVANRGIDNTRWYGNLKPGDKGYREAVVVSSDTGNAENADAKAHSAAEYQAQQFEIGRSQSQDLAHMREQALEAGLHGSALYHAQEAAAIQDLKFKDMDSVAARNAIHAKFHAEEMNRLRAEQDETEKLGRTAAMAGMTGIQKTQAEGANRVADINTDADKVGLDPAERAKRIAFANQETNQQIAEEQRTFTQEINALADSSAAHQVQGFARIHAEAAKELDGLQKKFDEVYGHMDRSTPGGEAQYQQGVSQLHAGQGMIASGESGQATELARKYGVEAVARVMEDAFTYQAFSCEYIANLLQQRQHPPAEPGALHLTRQADLLELELPGDAQHRGDQDRARRAPAKVQRGAGQRRTLAGRLQSARGGSPAGSQCADDPGRHRGAPEDGWGVHASVQQHGPSAESAGGDGRQGRGRSGGVALAAFPGERRGPGDERHSREFTQLRHRRLRLPCRRPQAGRGSGPGRAGQRRSSQRACTRLRG